jgi:hypothetical protein
MDVVVRENEMKKVILAAVLAVAGTEASAYTSSTFTVARTTVRSGIATLESDDDAKADCVNTKFWWGAKDSAGGGFSAKTCVDDDHAKGADDDAEVLTSPITDCSFVTSGSINQVDEANCYIEEYDARKSDGGKSFLGFDVGRRAQASSLFSVIRVLIKSVRRAVLAAQCHHQFDQLAGSSNACTVSCSSMSTVCNDLCTEWKTAAHCGSGDTCTTSVWQACGSCSTASGISAECGSLCDDYQANCKMTNEPTFAAAAN